MTWGYIIVMAVVLILGIALAPKPQGPRAAEIDDFDFPTAEEGRPIPVVFGEVDIRGSNVLWYGDLRVSPIKKRSGFSKSTVGYKYYLGWHMGLCHGPVDAITNILVGEKQAWSGNATGNTTIGINSPDLFGGEKREGGIAGSINVCMGADDQTANSYLSTQLASVFPGIPVPAFRGICCLVVNRTYIGTSAYPKVWAVRTRRILQGWQDDITWYEDKAVVDTRHMNPAHIIYQCLTDSRWGMGVDYSLIDETSFEAVADKLYDENFGMSVIWNQSESIEKFVQVILDHIAGGLTLNNSTGKYELLLVRGDYDVEDLDTYDESDIVRVIDYQRQGWGETVNEVTLVYTDPKTRKDTTISQQDIANIDAQGARIPQIIQLKGIQNHEVAKTVLARELVSRVTPLSKVVFEVNRRAWGVRYGGLFKLVYGPRNINGTVYRVLKATKGTLTANTIRIEALEDIYALGVNSSLATPVDTPDDETPPETPVDAEDTGANVISTTTTTPPATPSDGDSYLIPGDGTATGAWAGHEGQVADWDAENEEWIFTDVPDNQLVYDETTGEWHNVVGGVAEDPPWALPLTTKGDILVHDGTGPTRLAVGANGKVLKANSGAVTGLAWEDDATGGGGGDPGGGTQYSYTPFDDEPDTPDAMDDEFNDNSFDSVKWTWLNQDTATVTESISTYSHIEMVHSVILASDEYHAIEQALPGGNWKFRTKMFCNNTATNYTHAGISLRNSVNNRAYVFGPLGTASIYIQALTTMLGSGYDGTPATAAVSGVNQYVYLEVEYNGTNLIFRTAVAPTSTSNWNPWQDFSDPVLTTRLTVAPGTFLLGNPTHIGLAVGNWSSNSSCIARYDWFRRIS